MIVNLAMSADGKIALPDRTEVKISGEEDFARVHCLRHEADAILVGSGTVRADDPKLTVKERFIKKPEHPLRVVLDSKGDIPKDARLFDDDNYLIATTVESDDPHWVKCGDGERVDLHELMNELQRRGIKKVMVEGGGEVIHSFFEEDLVDEYNVYVGSLIIGGAKAPTPVDGKGALTKDDIKHLKLVSHTLMDDGVLLKYRVKK